jgi:hypothetical protein
MTINPAGPVINDARVAVTGICHLDMTGCIADYHAWVTSQRIPLHPEADLVVGETYAHGPIRLSCSDPAWWDEIAVGAVANAKWLREQREAAA